MVVLQLMIALFVSQGAIVLRDHQNQLYVLLATIVLQVFLLLNLVLSDCTVIQLA